MLWALGMVGWLAASALDVVASPRLGFAPATVTVEVRVDPALDWRELCVTVAGPESHQSCWAWSGARRTTRTLHVGTAGSYAVQAWGAQTSGRTVTAETSICLADIGTSC